MKVPFCLSYRVLRFFFCFRYYYSNLQDFIISVDHYCFNYSITCDCQHRQLSPSGEVENGIYTNPRHKYLPGFRLLRWGNYSMIDYPAPNRCAPGPLTPTYVDISCDTRPAMAGECSGFDLCKQEPDDNLKISMYQVYIFRLPCYIPGSTH